MRGPWTALPLGAGLLIAACAASNPPEPLARSGAAVSTSGPLASYFVVLEGPAAVRRIPDGVDPRSAQAAAAAQSRLREIDTEHAALRPALEEQGAVVIAELSRLANVIQVVATRPQVERLRRLPGVARVEEVPLLYPQLASLLPVVGAPEVWAKSTPLDGDGVTIGVIDSGIDYTHADFGGPGTVAAYTSNNSKIIEAGSFPTARVVGGWDFVGDDYNPTANVNVPSPDADPLDCTKPESTAVAGGHGTHVAGIAGGNGVKQDGSAYLGPYSVSFVPTAFRIAPGVAPKSRLWSLRIFGCDGSTSMLAAALERASDPNQDGNFADRLDVVNGSLGTGYALSSPVTTTMVENLTKVGTLLVTAAGNDGQTFFVVASPASIPQSLSVAASADNEFLALSVTSTAGTEKYAAAEGGFSKRLVDTGPISGPLVASVPANGCSALSNAAAISGKIALIDRGVCSFIQKFNNAATAGAAAVVIVDDEDEPLPFAMGGGDPGSVPIPGVMIRLVDGGKVKQALAQGSLTAGLDPSDPYTGVGAELLAGFSSRGPSSDDGRLKPEIAAPGFSIDSARVGSGNEPRRSQGTSQASPVVAGAAALVRQARPAFSPMEVKAALMNSTEPLEDLTSQRYQTSIVGSGRVAVERAVEQLITAGADVAGGEIGVAFGSVVSDTKTTVERSVTLTNHATSEAVLDATVLPTHTLPGVTVSVAPTSVKVAAGQSATVTVALSLDSLALGAPGPDPGTAPIVSQQARHYLNEASGNVRFVHSGGGAQDVLVPYQGSVRAGATRRGLAPKNCGPGVESTVKVALDGDSAHPEPVVTAFQLGALDDERAESATDPTVAMVDLRAIGAATDLATAASFDEAQIFFAVAVSGDWTTPARGPLSVVSINVDSDDDGNADFEIRAEARNKSFFFRDALASSTYAKGSEQRIRRLPLNLVTPDVAQTHVFNNSVLVFTALLSDLGVSADSPVLSYSAVIEDPKDLTLGEATAWARFDAGKPLLDTAKYGTDGLPLFVGPGPILVGVSEEGRTGSFPLDLLLLHHTNVAGSRFEVVSLAPSVSGDLGLGVAWESSVAAGATTDLHFTVANSGPFSVESVKLTGSATGGSVVSAAASQGKCDGKGELDCALGEMAPGSTVTVTATVRAGTDSQTLAVTAQLSSDLDCETTTANNSTTSSLSITPKAKPVPVYPAGGCDCRAASSAPTPRGSWIALGLAGLLAASRRRRRG